MTLRQISQRLNPRRILEHALFWLSALLMLTFFFGSNKPSYWWALQDNLIYLPLHMLYFYVLAYWVMPRLLFSKKYALFMLAAIFCILTSALMTRLIDMLIIDPRVYLEYKKIDPAFKWSKIEGTFSEQLFNIGYYANAIKGVNLVIWTALTIKFFKMWHERREAALEAELNFLKGQIHPHFLFNTLNNLYALSLTRSDKAPGIVMGLSEILKYMLYETKTPTILLSRDVAILENYIALEKIRYEDRLDLNIKIQDNLEGYQIAPLLLLPLVENTFKHGTSERIGDVWIKLDLTVKNNLLKLKLSNSKPETLPGDIERHKGNIGLPNVKKRLELLYPNAHDLKIFEDDDDMFVLILEIRLDKHIQ
jgi:hypothetical protein